MRVSIEMRAQLPKGFAVTIALLAVLVACDDGWEAQHESGPLLTDRPECPRSWGDSIPWFTPRDQKTTAYSSTVTYQPITGGVPGTGPITDIPEFHDCQRFLSTDGLSFDSLFAVFATYKQDSIVRALEFDHITWSSTNPQVATVDPTGLVEAVAVGTAIIKATSVESPGTSASRTIRVVQQGVVPPNPSSIDILGNGEDTLTETLVRQAVASLGQPTASTLPVATIYSYGQDYPQLGLKANFNCLYLYFDSSRRLTARMVPVIDLGNQIDACAIARNPQQNIGTPLKVVRSTVMLTGQPKTGSAYPAVARWEWNPGTSSQIVGLGCVDSWCEIGQPNDRGVFDPPDPYVLPAGSLPGDQRVVSVKGWHDEQILAVPDPANPKGLIPSSLRGTAIPAPDLATKGWSKTGPPEWKTAVYFALVDLSGSAQPSQAADFYRSRLNIVPAPVGPLKELNEMSYCFGTRSQCQGFGFWTAVRCGGLSALVGKHWWARITPAPTSAPKARYYCLVRRTHPSTSAMPLPTIPSTSRWRWILRDDTVWSECVQGCCETQVGGF